MFEVTSEQFSFGKGILGGGMYATMEIGLPNKEPLFNILSSVAINKLFYIGLRSEHQMFTLHQNFIF